MKQTVVVYLSILLLASFPVKAQVRPTAADPIRYTFKIIISVNSTFGYDIYRNDKPYIHQPTIPSVKGNNGFASKEKAIRTAQFVIKKIKAGVIPPSVTVEELKKIKAL